MYPHHAKCLVRFIVKVQLAMDIATLRPPPLCSLPSRLPHAICLTSPLFFMVLFCFFFIDAGHALCGVILEVDDAVR